MHVTYVPPGLDNDDGLVNLLSNDASTDVSAWDCVENLKNS